MIFFKINMVAMFIVGVCFSGAWADDIGWKKIGESKGIVGYTRPSPKSSVDQMDKNKVRMPILIADYILVPKGPDKTEVTYIALGDPGGNLPSFVVNLLTKNLSIQTLTGTREMVKKDKYKNVKSIITTTLH